MVLVMTIKELAEKHGVIKREFHQGAVVLQLPNQTEVYLERTSFGFIIQSYMHPGNTFRFDTIEELESELVAMKGR
jgi:hypothetical protein